MKNNLHSNQHLNPGQMERYVNGMMVHKERHQVEKHLLDCDFCQEAMEGLQNLTPIGAFKTDVELLKHKIEQKASSRVRRLIPYRELSIAASIAVLLGLGVYFLLINYDGDSDSIVVAEQEKIEDKRSEIKQDLIIQKERINQEQDNIETFEETESMVEEDQIMDIAAVEKPDRIEVIENVNNKSIAEEKNEAIDDIEIVEYSAPLILKDDTNIRGARGDIQENKNQDEALPFEKESDKKSESGERSQGKMREIEVAPQSSAISEPKATPGLVEKINKQAEPVGGSVAFQKYIKENLKFPSEAKEKDIKGSVVITFKVDRKGKISNFKVEKSLGHGCDEEATRLIKEGPKWTPAHKNSEPQSERASVTIEF